MKALIYSTHGFDRPFLEKAAAGRHELRFTEEALNEKTASMAQNCQAVALFTSDQADEAALRNLHAVGVRYVALRSVGYDHVDLETAQRLGMRVAHVPEYSPWSVAEHTLALLMALNRKLMRARELFMQNDFRLDELVGFDLHGKTVGILGTGRIGSVFARIMKGFGCLLVGCDIREDERLKKETGLRYVSLEEMAATADIFACFCPLNASTRHIINRKIFQRMKPGIYFLNTARGGIVCSEDLLWALEEGIVAAAGLDVYERERGLYFYDWRGRETGDPVFERLRHHPRVLMTAHQAFLTREALEAIAETTVQHLSNWERQGYTHAELL
jgi:D-lactate dehydrogenase